MINIEGEEEQTNLENSPSPEGAVDTTESGIN
jgi:hypothetical protein